MYTVCLMTYQITEYLNLRKLGKNLKLGSRHRQSPSFFSNLFSRNRTYEIEVKKYIKADMEIFLDLLNFTQFLYLVPIILSNIVEVFMTSYF